MNRDRGSWRAESPIIDFKSRTTGRCRYVSTKPIELRFKALLTEGDARVRFYREGFDGFATPSP
jgi:hypothetical protein